MKRNPFLSDTFKTIWLKHFNCRSGVYFFNIVSKLAFVKTKLFPLYYNVGKNNTKGISYKLSNTSDHCLKGKVAVICDIPTYSNTVTLENHPNLKLKKIIQYPGFRCVLKNYDTLDNYMLDVISRKSRSKFRSYKKKIEQTFGQSAYKVFFGDISDKDYTFIFEEFRALLKKRFIHKKTINNNLTPREWDFYKEVSLPMIRNKEAALFVIYDGEKPIAITLTNFSKNIMFDVIRVFDIDYSKYRLGIAGIMKQLEWCIENKMKALDFSKGLFEYKQRWSNDNYWFEYHIYYDKTSLIARFVAFFVILFYKFKLFLRRHDLINLAHRALFFRYRRVFMY